MTAASRGKTIHHDLPRAGAAPVIRLRRGASVAPPAHAGSTGLHPTTAALRDQLAKDEGRCQMSYLKRHGAKRTPQWAPLRGQVPNSAGGYAWEVDEWTRLRRFLILGSEGGSYYASE